MNFPSRGVKTILCRYFQAVATEAEGTFFSVSSSDLVCAVLCSWILHSCILCVSDFWRCPKTLIGDAMGQLPFSFHWGLVCWRIVNSCLLVYTDALVHTYWIEFMAEVLLLATARCLNGWERVRSWLASCLRLLGKRRRRLSSSMR